MVEPDFDSTRHCASSIVHLDTILCSVHLMGVAGGSLIPCHLKFYNSLDTFQAFYINKNIDYYSYKIAFSNSDTYYFF